MLRLAAPALLIALGAACVSDLGEGRVEAEVTEAPEETKRQLPSDATSLKIDTSKSKVHALGAKVTGTHEMVFDQWEGTVKVSGDQVVGLDFVVDMASVNADHPKLTVHLKDADFFDVGKFPTSTFASTKVAAKAGADGATHEVTGTLTIRGKAKQVTFPATIGQKDGAYTAHTEFVLNRKDFDIVYPGRPDDLVQDKVVLTIDWVAPKA